MTYLRRLGSHFDLDYLKPTNLSRAVTVLRMTPAENSLAGEQFPPRRALDRRCGIDRRKRQLPIILDTRSSHARRMQPRRRDADTHPPEAVGVGIDVYA